jgi:predicted transcriptional regulator
MDSHFFTTFVVLKLDITTSVVYICGVQRYKIHDSAKLIDKMTKQKQFEPSNAELEILQVLWENQPATVKVVHEKLSSKREVGYTTILKQMQRMFDKGMVKRNKEGKTHWYNAIPHKQEVQQTLTSQLVDKAFSGSAMKMVMHALGQGETSQEELEALQQWLDQQKEDNQ